MQESWKVRKIDQSLKLFSLVQNYGPENRKVLMNMRLSYIQTIQAIAYILQCMYIQYIQLRKSAAIIISYSVHIIDYVVVDVIKLNHQLCFLYCRHCCALSLRFRFHVRLSLQAAERGKRRGRRHPNNIAPFHLYIVNRSCAVHSCVLVLHSGTFLLSLHSVLVLCVCVCMFLLFDFKLPCFSLFSVSPFSGVLD